jgi:hypothetical protein
MQHVSAPVGVLTNVIKLALFVTFVDSSKVK